VHFNKKGDVRKRNTRNGSNQCLLGAMCVVMVYASWESYYRNEIAAAMDIKRNDIKVDLWGDLMALRDCMLHNDYVMSEEKFKLLKLIKWFGVGDTIIIDEAKFTAIFMALLDYRNWIHSQGLKKTYITISRDS
jgi:hypothetical protein